MSQEAVLAEENVPEVSENLIPVYVMGKKYLVPESLTIMKAMEYAGYKFVRGAGCRGGVCGACGTVYRLPGDYHIRVGLACQTVVQAEMYLTQIPFFPANRAIFNWEEIKGKAEEVYKAYPELFRCLACNACTKVCPMDIEVMDYIAAVKRGDLDKAAEISFDCIQCGLCATRCMGEMAQYHIAQMVRRIRGKFIATPSEHCEKQVKAIQSNYYEASLKKLMDLGTLDPFQQEESIESIEQLKMLYNQRQMEPAGSENDWIPDSDIALLK